MTNAVTRIQAAALVVLVLIAGVGYYYFYGRQPSAEQELIVYSGRKESAIKPVTDLFQQKTGIKVILKVGKTGDLLNQIVREKSDPVADVFISTVASAVDAVAKKEGVFQPYFSPNAKDIPDEYKSSKGIWIGISGRARVIIYNKNLVKENEVPKSVYDLVGAKWKDKIAIASTRERTTLTWVASLVSLKGEENTRDYVKKLMDNGLKLLPDNTDVWRGIGSGEFALGLTNSPNYHLAVAAGFPVGVIYPDQDNEVGVLVNVNTISVIKGAKHLEAAKRFVDFLLSPDAQRVLTEKDYEIPLLKGSSATTVKALAQFKEAKVSQEKLGEIEESTLKMLRSINPKW